MGKRIGAGIILALLLLLWTSAAKGAAAWGDRGADVTKIQQRLRQFGYLNAPADGIFGQATYNAVVWFQRQNGLKADGVVGPATAAALGITLSGGSAPAASYHESEVYTLARLVHAEARGEPYLGKVACKPWAAASLSATPPKPATQWSSSTPPRTCSTPW